MKMPLPTKEDTSRKFMVGSSDSETDNEDLALVHLVLRKLNINDQALLHRHFDKVPDAFSSLWRDQYERLDLGQMQWKLHGSNLHLFLQDMCTGFRSVHLRSEQLQEELNILEQAGIERLVNVESCEISGGHSPSTKNRSFPQWPFHALPKLLSNLIYLEIHASVQACFIDRFRKLESLKIYAEISSSALKAILSSDMPLTQLHLLGNLSHQLEEISKCKQLRNLLVNLPTFLSSPSELCQLPELLVLRLTQLKELDIKATLKALSRVIQEKGSQLKSFQLNCNFMDHAKYLSQMKLNLCLSLDELELVDCIFKNQDLTKLCLPVSQSYTLFCNCPDLNDDQLLDFIKASPNLKELVLIECPKLTEELLNNVVKVRCSGEEQPPLLFRIKDSQDIWDSYQKNLSSLWARKRSILKLECIAEEYVPIDNVQFIFHEPLRSPIVL